MRGHLVVGLMSVVVIIQVSYRYVGLIHLGIYIYGFNTHACINIDLPCLSRCRGMDIWDI
jgi:hypothetical protein